MSEKTDNTIKIFISSPSDIEDVVKELIKSIERKNNSQQDVFLEHYSWTDWSLPLSESISPAIMRNSKIVLPSQCDLVYAVFGYRLGDLKEDERKGIDKIGEYINPIKGTKGRFRSGTEWEIFEALQGRKNNNSSFPQFKGFRVNQPQLLSDMSLEQAEKIKEIAEEHLRLTKYLATEFNEVLLHLNIEDTSSDAYFHEADKAYFANEFWRNLRYDIDEILELRKIAKKNILAQTLPGPNSVYPYDLYLKKLIKDNNKLELTGFGKLANNPHVNLEQVFVALKADKTKSYEISKTHELQRIREKTYNWLTPDEKRRVQENDRALVGFRQISTFNNPQGKTYKFDEVIKELRWTMTLGNPGGGKTTLVRWLTLKMAQAYSAYIKNKQNDRFQVPINQINPDSNSNKIVDLGKVRLPILIQIAHYAKEADKRKVKKNEEYSLWEYIGNHQGPRGGGFREVSNEIKKMLINAIENGEALIILDGMDEIPQTLKNISRQHIADEIKAFKEHYLEKYNKKKGITNQSPFSVGGNQLIVTSRITGYESAVVADLVHLIIQPMSKTAIERFCDLWMNADYKARNGKRKITEDDKKIINKEINGLVDAIYSHHHKSIQELASNPLLLTVIALVYKDNEINGTKKGLPERRAELYQQALEILIHDWKATDLNTEQIINILTRLASYMHSYYPDGCVTGDELRRFITEGLKIEKPELENPALKNEADNLFNQIQNNIGLIYSRGHDLFAFLHLTFQEYLAGLSLLTDNDNKSESLIEKIYDPRWREPILLSLGFVAWREKVEINLLVDAILNSDKEINYLVPQGIFVLLEALPELEKISDENQKRIINTLLQSYSKLLTTDFEQIQGKIESCILRLSSNYKLFSVVETTMVEAIYQPDLAASTTVLADRLEFLSGNILNAMMHNLHYDSQVLNFPILNVLMSMADCPIPKVKTSKPKSQTEEEKKVFFETNPIEAEKLQKLYDIQLQLYEHQCLIDEQQIVETTPIQNIPLRKALERNPNLIEKIKSDKNLLKLITMFYGGYAFYKRDEIEREYAELSFFLQKPDIDRERLIAENPAYYLRYGDYEDTIYKIAVYLDTNMQGRNLREFRTAKLDFKVEGFFKDSLLSREIYNFLLDVESEEAFKDRLLNLWSDSSIKDNDRRAEIYICLLILGIDCSKNLKESQPFLIPTVLKKLEIIKKQLQDSVFRSRDSIWEDLKTNIPLNQKGIDILLTFQQITLESSSVPIEFSNLKDKKTDNNNLDKK